MKSFSSNWGGDNPLGVQSPVPIWQSHRRSVGTGRGVTQVHLVSNDKAVEFYSTDLLPFVRMCILSSLLKWIWTVLAGTPLLGLVHTRSKMC